MPTNTAHLPPDERRRSIQTLARMRAEGCSWEQISAVLGRSGEIFARSLFIDMLNGLADQAPTQFARIGQSYGGDLDAWLRDTAAVINQHAAATRQQPPSPPVDNEALLRAAGRKMGEAITRHAAFGERVMPQQQVTQGYARPTAPTPRFEAGPPVVAILRALHFIVRDIMEQHMVNGDVDYETPAEEHRVEAARDILAEITTALEDAVAE